MPRPNELPVDDAVEVVVGEGSGDRDGERALVVRLAHLLGGEVEPPEGAERRPTEGRDRAGDQGERTRVVLRCRRDSGQGEPLGVHELELGRGEADRGHRVPR